MGQTKKVYEYHAFGLNITSDFILDGMFDSNGKADVIITDGKLEEHFSGLNDEGSYFCVKENGFFLRQQNVGKFFVTSGNRIVVELEEGENSPDFELYLRGTCFGVLLMQRGMIPIHGSALAADGKCIIITGKSGAGKSTLAAALNQRGYQFISDDIVALNVDGNGDVWVVPGYPQQKLWRDSAEILLGGVKQLKRINAMRDKYYLPVRRNCNQENVKLAAILELEPAMVERVGIKELSGMDKLKSIIGNTYRIELIDNLGIAKEHFSKCAAISKKVSVVQIVRPDNGFTIEEQINAACKFISCLV